MISVPCFTGDNSEELFDLQNHHYSDVCSALLNKARQRYSFAEEVLQKATPEGKSLSVLKGYDHRVLQHAHDLIAAVFRFKYLKLPLFPDPIDIANAEQEWLKFAREECTSLVDDPEFCRAVVNAVVHANKSEGINGEERMRHILETRYREMVDGDHIRWEKMKEEQEKANRKS